jgi:hypothetical protein
VKIAFVLHEVHKTGGQERSTLEIINRLSQKHEVHVFAFNAEDLNLNVKFHKVYKLISKPFFIKEMLFRIFVDHMLVKEKFDIINGTGNVSFLSNVITVQFFKKLWI